MRLRHFGQKDDDLRRLRGLSGDVPGVRYALSQDTFGRLLQYDACQGSLLGPRRENLQGDVDGRGGESVPGVSSFVRYKILRITQ